MAPSKSQVKPVAQLSTSTAQLRGTRKKPAAAVKASGTTLTRVFGAGPVVAGTITGDVTGVARFPGRDHFAACNGTAPARASSGNRKVCRLSLRGSRRVNHAIHMAAITRIRHRHSDGRACYEKKPAGGRRTRKRSGPSSGGSATPSSPACTPMPGEPRKPPSRAREGNRGTTLHPARPAHTPHAGSSGKPLPGLTPRYGPARQPAHLLAPCPAGRSPGAGLGIPRSLPLSHRQSGRPRWSARSEARTNDLEVRRDGGRTRQRGRPRWVRLQRKTRHPL